MLVAVLSHGSVSVVPALLDVTPGEIQQHALHKAKWLQFLAENVELPANAQDFYATSELMALFGNLSPILIERQAKSDPPPAPRHTLIQRLDFNSH